jgi:hypothetical protein
MIERTIQEYKQEKNLYRREQLRHYILGYFYGLYNAGAITAKEYQEKTKNI